MHISCMQHVFTPLIHPNNSLRPELLISNKHIYSLAPIYICLHVVVYVCSFCLRAASCCMSTLLPPHTITSRGPRRVGRRPESTQQITSCHLLSSPLVSSHQRGRAISRKFCPYRGVWRFPTESEQGTTPESLLGPQNLNRSTDIPELNP